MPFYEIKAKADDHAEIRIYSEIGWSFWGDSVEAKQFVDDLDNLKVSTISLRINSPGGDVFDGNTIYNALKRHDAQITTYVDGIAASIASVIALAGDKVIMAKNAMMMIHEPWSVVGGGANDMRACADVLDMIREGLIATYQGKAPQHSTEVWNEKLAAETWFTADAALEFGLADEVAAEETPVAALATFSPKALGKFRHVPAQIAAIMRTPPPAEDSQTIATSSYVSRELGASSGVGIIDPEAMAAHERRVRDMMALV